MESEVVKITKKGQATISKYLREKFGFKDLSRKMVGCFRGRCSRGEDQHRIYQEAERALLWQVLGFFWKQTDFAVNSHLILLIIKMPPVIRVLENQE